MFMLRYEAHTQRRAVYPPRASQATVSRTTPDHIDHNSPDHKTDFSHEINVRLARSEAALDAEREKTAMLQRHVDDLRRMLPPPDAKPRRYWWPW